MRRKILIVASWFPTASHPVNGIFIQEQAQILSREHDVAILAPRVIGWNELLRNQGGPWSADEVRDGITVRHECAFTPIPYFYRLAYARYLRVARRGLQRLFAHWGRPDLIHAHVILPGGWAATLLGQEYDIPVLLTEHSNPFSMHLHVAYKRECVRATLRDVVGTLAVSPALADQIRAFDPDVQVEVVGNVIRTEYFTPVPTPTSRATHTRLLVIGLLSVEKGISYMLIAAQLLRQRGTLSFELVIGGDGPEREQLELQMRQLGIEESCRFVGMLDRSEVRGWMQWCDLFILPSLRETFGIVLGEAMACGKPVVATRCGGAEFLVTPETGQLVEPANPTLLADAIEQWASMRDSYDSVAIRKHIVDRFGESAFLQNVSAWYDRILGL